MTVETSRFHSSSLYWGLTLLPILESIFFAIVGIELLLSVCSTLLWRGFSAHHYVPTTPLAKPTQPSWGGCKDKATFVIPLHDGDAREPCSAAACTLLTIRTS